MERKIYFYYRDKIITPTREEVEDDGEECVVLDLDENGCLVNDRDDWNRDVCKALCIFHGITFSEELFGVCKLVRGEILQEIKPLLYGKREDIDPKLEERIKPLLTELQASEKSMENFIDFLDKAEEILFSRGYLIFGEESTNFWIQKFASVNNLFYGSDFNQNQEFHGLEQRFNALKRLVIFIRDVSRNPETQELDFSGLSERGNEFLRIIRLRIKASLQAG